MKMILILLILFTPYAASSQGVSFGVKVGVNRTTATYTTSPDFRYQFGKEVDAAWSLSAGIILIKEFEDGVGISTSIMLDSKRLRFMSISETAALPESQEGNEVRYDYLVVAPRLQWGTAIGTYFTIGPSIGIRTKAEGVRPNWTRFAFSFGTGIRIKTGSVSLCPEISYDVGLSDTDEGPEEWRLSSLQFGLAVLF